MKLLFLRRNLLDNTFKKLLDQQKKDQIYMIILLDKKLYVF